MASRDIELLTPSLKYKALVLKAEALTIGLDFVITCTARDFKEQVALYAQGRQPLDEVNALRKVANLAPISDLANKNKVTWTLKSKHIINLDDSDINNDKAKAFDIVLLKDGRAHWDIKVDINKDNIPDYAELGAIGEKLGLVWGGRWKKPDYPHFEEA